MKLIVFSNHDKLHSETKHVVQLFENGLQTFHLRKPGFSAEDLTEYMNQIPEDFHRKIVLHTHHKLAKKFHFKGLHFTRTHRKKKYASRYKFFLFKMKHPNLAITRSCGKVHQIEDLSSRYSYVFLYPIFESISKKAHAGIFSERQLRNTLSKTSQNVIALGGVDETKFEELHELGFKGVALLGAIWKSDTPLETYLAAEEKLLSITKEKNNSY